MSMPACNCNTKSAFVSTSDFPASMPALFKILKLCVSYIERIACPPISTDFMRYEATSRTSTSNPGTSSFAVHIWNGWVDN